MQSSNIYAAGYDAASHTLEIEFATGSVYQYHDVPPETWQQFQSDSSKGTFYNKKIKGKYEGREL